MQNNHSLAYQAIQFISNDEVQISEWSFTPSRTLVPVDFGSMYVTLKVHPISSYPPSNFYDLPISFCPYHFPPVRRFNQVFYLFVH